MHPLLDVLLSQRRAVMTSAAHRIRKRSEGNFVPFATPASISVVARNETTSTSNVTDSMEKAGQNSNSVSGFYHLHEVPHTLGTIIVLSCFVVVVVGCTLIGNTLVCLAVGLVRKLRKQAANYLLVSLAVADLCVGVMVMPLAFLYLILGRWPFGQFLCDVWTYADVTLCTASILNLCVISVDRYFAIVRPLSYCPKRTSGRMMIYILIVWVAAVLVSFLPPIALLSSASTDEICEVSQNPVYQVYATMCAFYIPATIILVVNYKIFKAARRLTLADKRASAMTGSASSTMAAAAAVIVASTPVVREEGTKTSALTVRRRFSIRGFIRTPSFFGYGNRRKRVPEDSELDRRGDEIDCALETNHVAPTPNHHSAACSATGTPRTSRDGLFHFDLSFGNRLKPGRRSISKHLTDAFANRSISQRSSITSNWERFHARDRYMSAPTTQQQRRSRSDWSSRGSGGSRHILHSRLRQHIGHRCKQAHHHSQASTETKAMKTLGLIMGCFIACWLPFFIVALLKALCGDRCSVPGWVDSVVLWLGYANSTLNPLLYAKYNKDFRIPFREMLCCRFSTLKSVLRMEEYRDTFGSYPSSLDGNLAMPVAVSNNGASNHDQCSTGAPLEVLSARSVGDTGVSKSSSSPAGLNQLRLLQHQQQPETLL